MRIAIGFGWTTLVAAEMVAATHGLGQMVLNASNFLRTDIVIMGIVVIGAVAYLFDLLMRYVERARGAVEGQGLTPLRPPGRRSGAVPPERLSSGSDVRIIAAGRPGATLAPAMITATRTFQRLVEAMRATAPAVAGGVRVSLRRRLAAARAVRRVHAATLAPMLVGPEARGSATPPAKAGHRHLAAADRRHRRRPARGRHRAVELARDGSVAALVKGSLAATRPAGAGRAPNPACAANGGCRTRISSIFPARPQRRAASPTRSSTSRPNLAAKKDIVRTRSTSRPALGIAAPKVALLAAIDCGEPRASRRPPTPRRWRRWRSEGAFGGAVVDGPLTADSALSSKPRAGERP